MTGDDDEENHGKGRDDLDWIDTDEDEYDLGWDAAKGMYLRKIISKIIPYGPYHDEHMI